MGEPTNAPETGACVTVIVASCKGMIADSKCTAGDSSYRSKKIIRWKGEIIGVAGSNPGIEKFLFWYRGKRDKPITLDDDENFEVIVVNKRGMFTYGNSSLPDPVVDEFYFAGNGNLAAKAAMLAGADMRRAVEIACEVVEACGLPIQEEWL
jgi:hypothetical protein